jgi:hypothetical protein
LTTYASASAGIIYSSILHEQTIFSSSIDSLPPPLISRSHHLQELHLFLEALSSIRPTDPHFESCKKAFSIFSRVNEVLLGRVTTKLPNDGTVVAVPAESDMTDCQYSSAEYSPLELESNSMGFVTLPWLDYVWCNSEEELFFQSAERINFEPVTGNPPAEFASGT